MQRIGDRFGLVRAFAERPGGFYVAVVSASTDARLPMQRDYAAIINPARHELERARDSVTADFLRLHGRPPSISEVDGILVRYWYRLSDACDDLLRFEIRRRERAGR